MRLLDKPDLSACAAIRLLSGPLQIEWPRSRTSMRSATAMMFSREGFRPSPSMARLCLAWTFRQGEIVKVLPGSIGRHEICMILRVVVPVVGEHVECHPPEHLPWRQTFVTCKKSGDFQQRIVIDRRGSDPLRPVRSRSDNASFACAIEPLGCEVTSFRTSQSTLVLATFKPASLAINE